MLESMPVWANKKARRLTGCGGYQIDCQTRGMSLDPKLRDSRYGYFFAIISWSE